jgi:biotin carboxylase
MSRVIAIVDTYSPTEILADQFRASGAELVRVQSTKEVPPAYRGHSDTSNYLDNVIHQGDLAATVRAVSAHNPEAVVPGGEIGVEFTDVLTDQLGLPGNGTKLSEARRNKFIMIETVRRAGLDTANQILVRETEDLVEWHRKIGGRIVVKPLRSAGNDNVAFCDTPANSAAALTRILAADDVFSMRNDAAVAQEYLRGTEYMFNTVSRDGIHRICEVWSTSRVSANGVVDLTAASFLMPHKNPIKEDAGGYVCDVLDAVGIRNGPAHLELRMTKRGPVLIEVAARICGAHLPLYAQLARGGSQLEWTVNAYLQPQRFVIDPEEPTDGRFCASVGFVSSVEGIFDGFRSLELIKELESFYKLEYLVRPGETLHRTVNDSTYAMAVILMHEDQEAVLRDANTLRHLDGPQLYKLRAYGPSGGCVA